MRLRARRGSSSKERRVERLNAATRAVDRRERFEGAALRSHVARAKAPGGVFALLEAARREEAELAAETAMLDSLHREAEERVLLQRQLNMEAAMEKKQLERKRNLMILILSHCVEHGYLNTAEQLQQEAGLAPAAAESVGARLYGQLSSHDRVAVGCAGSAVRLAGGPAQRCGTVAARRRGRRRRRRRRGRRKM